jgi:integrase
MPWPNPDHRDHEAANRIGRLSMPKPRRQENKGLPKRWQFFHGAYYYRVPPGLEGQWDGKKRFRLGSSLSEAHKTFAERIEAKPVSIHTIGTLLDQYLTRVVPDKVVTTQSSNRVFIAKLREVFGHMPLRDLKPHHVYGYVERRKAKVSAHREIEVLSHAYTKAVEWGVLDKHPFKGEVRLEGEPSRDRYVEDWEVIEALSLTPRRKAGSVLMIQAYIRLKLLTGLGQGDLLRLRLDEHIKTDGIHVQRHKTKTRKTVYDYALVPERRDAVEQAKRTRPALSPFLFCNRRGQGYVNETNGEARGFKSMWQRFMDRVLKETKVKVPFTEHDLRAKAGSDAETLEKARALLQHADSRTTLAIYRRKPERV